MNAAKLLFFLLLLFLFPEMAFSESTVQGSAVNTPVKIENSANIAAGSENKAGHSAIVMKNVRLKGNVLNSVQTKNSVNIAAGKRNKADQASIRIENSKIRGSVVNSSSIQQSANLAVGTGNTASQAAVVVGGVQLNGMVVNNAAASDSVNAAMGVGNEAHQSSIVVDDVLGSRQFTGAVGSQTDTASSANGVVKLLSLPAPGAGNSNLLTTVNRMAKQAGEKTKASRYVTGQVLFLVDNDQAGLASLERIAGKYKLNVGEKTVLSSLNRIMVVAATSREAQDIAAALKDEPGVYNPQPNYVFSTMGGEDPLSHMQNLVSMLDMPAMHARVSGNNVTVAVVDTGVEVEHQDLRGRIVGHRNFIADSAYRGEIHGTAVAGIIGAERNEYGIVGLAPDVSLLALRACRQLSEKEARGECYSTSLAASLDAAISARVDVVNLSLGAEVDDPLLGIMIDSGHEKGLLFAAPVGNDPDGENIAFPASHENVVSVAGLDEQGKPLPNKRLASLADAVAPAAHLFVTAPGNSYNFSDGTSLATAVISGILVLSREKPIASNQLHLPRFTSDTAWPQQVVSCLGL